MNEEVQRLTKEFIAYESMRGIKNTKTILSHLKPFFSYLEKEGLTVSDVRIKQAQEFQTWLSTLSKRDGSVYYATLTVISIISMVRRLYDYLKHKGVVYANPFLRIKRMRTERTLPRDIPTEQVMDKFLALMAGFRKQKTLLKQKAYYRAHVMAELQYATGLRIQELLDLKREQIDFEKKVIHVKRGKGGKERLVYLNEYSSDVLKIYVTRMRALINRNTWSERVFGIKDKGTITDTYHKVLKEAARKQGLTRFTSHSFRHSLGFHLLRRGCDMRYIQLILGHEDMNSTAIYTRVEKSDLKSVLDRCHPRQFRSIRDDNKRNAG